MHLLPALAAHVQLCRLSVHCGSAGMQGLVQSASIWLLQRQHTAGLRGLLAVHTQSLCWRPRLPAALLSLPAWAAPCAAERFARSGIKLVLNSRVKAVQDGYVTVVDKEGSVSAPVYHGLPAVRWRFDPGYGSASACLPFNSLPPSKQPMQ